MGSEGSCTHFTELVLPSFQTGEFRMRLPKRAQLISVSAYGIEMQLPPLEDQVCRVRLPDRDARATGQRLSFRLAYPPVRLGFVGSVELGLPEVFQTIGTLSWVVALPTGFESQVISSGLEIQKGPPDLAGFGDYGRILKGNPTTWLTKDLAVPSPVSLNLRYRQSVAGW